MKSKIYDIVRIGVAVALLTSGVAYATGTWSEPTAAFPSGNVDAPINVGATNQVKSGSIGAAAFSTLNTSIDKAGDGAGIFRKISIQNTSGTEVAKIDTLGGITGTSLAAGKTVLQSDGTVVFKNASDSILAAVQSDGTFRASKLSIQNTSGTEVAKIGTAGLIVGTGLQVTTNPGDGKVLTSDSNGVATWRANAAPTAFKFVNDIYAHNYGACSTTRPSCGAGWRQLAETCEGGDAEWYRWVILCGQ